MSKQWRFSPSGDSWLVFNESPEGFVVTNERTAKLACHYLNDRDDALLRIRGCGKYEDSAAMSVVQGIVNEVLPP